MASSFSASDVAFEGFRLARERPFSILVWAGLTLVFNLVSAALMVGLGGEAFAQAMAINSNPDADPAEALEAMSALAPAYGLLTPLTLGFYAVLYAAAYRAVLRPSQAPGSGDVQVGGDEGRQVLALVAVGLILGISGFIIVLVATLIAAVVGGGLAVAAGGGAAAAGGGAVAALVMIAALAGVFWLAVKLSLVGPYTFDRRSLDLPAAWRLTKGATWPLLGAYLLAFVLMLVVYLLGLMIFAGVGAAVGGGLEALGSVFSPDLSSFGAYFTPMMLIYLIVASVLSALTFAILVGATAAAYRALSPNAMVEAFA